MTYLENPLLQIVSMIRFPVVMPELGYMPHRNCCNHDEAKLLYVAMMWAMDQLILTSSKELPFVSRIQQVNQQLDKPPSEKGILSGIQRLLGRT